MPFFQAQWTQSVFVYKLENHARGLNQYICIAWVRKRTITRKKKRLTTIYTFSHRNGFREFCSGSCTFILFLRLWTFFEINKKNHIEQASFRNIYIHIYVHVWFVHRIEKKRSLGSRAVSSKDFQTVERTTRGPKREGNPLGRRFRSVALKV